MQTGTLRTEEQSCCPDCGSTRVKKNGHIHNGKQNHRCKECGRQFVLESTQKRITAGEKEKIRKLLAERIALRGICRVMDVSLKWLLGFMVSVYEKLPEDLNFRETEETDEIVIYALASEVDEMWSFVGNKKNKQWIWIAMDVKTRQIIAFYVGDRSRDSAQELWQLIPAVYRQKATFYTDKWEAYEGVIPKKQHQAVDKQSGKTNHIERFNCTMRQRVSRLVRKALSFSKKLTNHIAAIKYFICCYNLEKQLSF